MSCLKRQSVLLTPFAIFSYFAVLEMYSKLKEQLESKRYASHNAFQHYVTDV